MQNKTQTINESHDSTWKPCQIFGKANYEVFPGYKVSPIGEVWSEKTQRVLAKGINQKGYPTVQIYNDAGKCKTVTVHRLVASAYLPNPEQKPQVNHLNKDKNDSKASNLEWCTGHENMRHARALVVHLLSPEGDIITVDCLSAFAQKSGLSQSNLHSVLSGKASHHKGWRSPLFSDGPFHGRIRGESEFKVISPSGKSFSGSNIRQFAELNGLCRIGLTRLINGKIKNHRGWTSAA